MLRTTPLVAFNAAQWKPGPGELEKYLSSIQEKERVRIQRFLRDIDRKVVLLKWCYVLDLNLCWWLVLFGGSSFDATKGGKSIGCVSRVFDFRPHP